VAGDGGKPITRGLPHFRLSPERYQKLRYGYSEIADAERTVRLGCATLATFNSTWDRTAIGTLVLAAVTLAVVIVAAIGLRKTRAGLALSRREVEESNAPAGPCALWSIRGRWGSRISGIFDI
jgi:hypothetical protein